MLTLFFTAKPFRDEAGQRQRNAIRSWTMLRPRPQILLFGEGEGYEDVTRQLELQHIPAVACNRAGVPLLRAMFDNAQEIAANRMLCYVDADILLLRDFMIGIEAVKEVPGRSLLVGSSWELDPSEVALSLDRPEWEDVVRAHAVPPRLNNRNLYGIDFFAFARGTLQDLPSFADGAAGWNSPGWDNKLIHFVRSRGDRVIDGTGVMTVVHQKHEPPVPAGVVATASTDLFSLADATHILTPKGLRPATRPHHLWRRLYALTALNRNLMFLRPLIDVALRASAPIRRPLGLTVTGLAGIGKPTRRRH